jgi:predicted nucleotidyltransferase/DNA-binding XRE family transcriptional regulator
VTSAGQLLRDARTRAGLSQTDLARSAGVAQSVVSDYERHRREPGLTTLSRLVAATGHTLTLDVVPGEHPVRGLPDTRLGRRLRRHRRRVLALASAHGATNVRVFGSVARGEDGPASDVDLLVDLAPGTGLLALIGLARELGDLLGTSVDVVPADSLKPARRASILQDAVAL